MDSELPAYGNWLTGTGDGLTWRLLMAGLGQKFSFDTPERRKDDKKQAKVDIALFK